MLDLITQESRQSLDSIRDTLERLVHLAQDGEVHPGLDFDLAALRETNHRVVKDGALVGHQLPPVALMDSGLFQLVSATRTIQPKFGFAALMGVAGVRESPLLSIHRKLPVFAQFPFPTHGKSIYTRGPIFWRSIYTFENQIHPSFHPSTNVVLS